MRQGWIHRVLAHVSLDPEVVRSGVFVLWQGASLKLVLVCRVPRSQDDLTAATHGLRVRRHHADGAEVVQDVFGGDGLSAYARLGKGNVLGDVLGEVVADHEHINVLVQGVARVRTGGVRRGGKDIRVLDNGDDVGSVATAGAFRVVGVNSAILKGRDGGFHKP